MYRLVLAVHIAAVLVTYGLPVAYPLMLPYLRRTHPHAMRAVHDMQHRMNQRVAVPGSVVIATAGGYMAIDGGYWDEPWLIAGVTIFTLISIIGGRFIVPVSARLAELAGEAPGTEYDATFRRYMRVEIFLGLLVLLAIFFMTAKPFSG